MSGQQPRKPSLGARALAKLTGGKKDTKVRGLNLFDGIPADRASGTAFPAFVLVTGAAKNNKKVRKTIDECRVNHDPFVDATLGLYSTAQAHEDHFKRVFAGETQNNLPFQRGILYKHHLNEGRHDYYAVDEFDHVMWAQQMDEMFEIARHVVAFRVSSSITRSASNTRNSSTTGNVSGPAYAPSPGGDGTLGSVGMSGGRTRDNDTAQTEELLFVWEHSGLKLPHGADDGTVLPDSVALDGWYFYHHEVNKSGRFSARHLHRVVTTALQGTYDTKTVTIDLAKTDMTSEAYAFNVALAGKILSKVSSKDAGLATTTSQDLAGIAFDRSLKVRTATDVHYKFVLEFFDAADYKMLRRASASDQVRHNAAIKRVSGELATLRWRNFRVQEESRADIALHKRLGMQTEPWRSESTRHKFGPSWRVGDLIDNQPGPAEGGSNIVRIPITMYGPAGGGKSSVLGTWLHASHDSAYLFMTRTWHQYAKRVRDTALRNNEEDLVITEAIFSNALGPEGPGVPASWATAYPGPRGRGRELDEEQEAALKKFDYLSVAFQDSRPAASYLKDVKGFPLPFGLQVLVLAAVDVFDASQMDETDHRRVSTLKGWQAFFSTELLGQEAFREHKVYPPLAIILAGTNRIDVPANEDPVPWLKAAVADMTKMLVNRFDCDPAHVIPMDTFAVPTDAEEAEYRKDIGESGLKSDSKKVAADKAWRRTMANSLQALEDLMDLIRRKETESLEIVLASDASGSAPPAAPARRGSGP